MTDPVMKIRLTRKLADYLDGIDVSQLREGDVVALPRREAELLIAEKWAAPLGRSSANERRAISTRPDRAVAAERHNRRVRTSQKKP
jgi:hypothetical protein